MATLEKIRSKSVMLLIVIGVALLAFIIGDFLNSGRSFFGAGTTVAKVDGTKIGIAEYQRRYEVESERMQQSGQKMDGAVMQASVLENMINEQLFNDEVADLDLLVTSAEMTEAMTGANASPMVVQFANQMGFHTPAELHDMLFNPGKYGMTNEQVLPVKTQWLEMEQAMEDQLKQQKLAVLLSGALAANDLDKAALADDMQTAATVNVANVAYSSIDNKDYPVSEEEMKARYEKEKSQYPVEEELRKIHYIAVNVIPSEADKAEAQKLVDSVAAKLRANPGIDAIRNISDLVINERTVRAKDVDAATRTFLETADVEGLNVQPLRGDEHSMTKLLAKRMDVDSINVNMVQVAGGKAVQDSVLNLLVSGKPFAEVVNNQTVGGQENLWQNVLQIPKDDKSQEAKRKLLNAGEGYFILDSNDSGALIYKVNSKVAPKQVYDIAEVSYTVYPSDKTIDDLRLGLQTYINKNNTGKLFVDNAVAAGYQPIEATVSATMPQVNRIASTRKLIQWAFGAEAGSVSSIFEEGNDKMIALTLDEVIPVGYMPLTDPIVRNMIETQVRNDKKGEVLLAKYDGKASDLAGYAKLMNVPVDTAVVVTFSQDYVPAMRGAENTLIGRAPYAKQGSFSGPVKGEQGVYVYQVAKVEKSNTQLTPQQLESRYAMTLGANAVMQNIFGILRENKEIENNMIDFY